MRQKLLFLAKADDSDCALAGKFLDKYFDTEKYFGRWGDRLPEDLGHGEWDYIVSYLGRWVLPESILGKARIAAINFHPAPPEYPGVGCNNFALYDEVDSYGVTCHFMAPEVDTGKIIETRRFAIFSGDDLESMFERTYANQIVLFYDVIARILRGDVLTPSGEEWSRETGTRKALDALARITPDMSPDEVSRRVRATSFRQWRPYVEVGGRKFTLTE